MIVFEIWDIEKGKWVEANFATIPLGTYTLRISNRITLNLIDISEAKSEESSQENNQESQIHEPSRQQTDLKDKG